MWQKNSPPIIQTCCQSHETVRSSSGQCPQNPTAYLSCDSSRMARVIAHYELFKKAQDVEGDMVEAGVFKGTALARFAMFQKLILLHLLNLLWKYFRQLFPFVAHSGSCFSKRDSYKVIYHFVNLTLSIFHLL